MPARLQDLAGPADGTVDLPLHVVWSGRSSFSLDRPKARMGLYRTVFAEGQRDDLIRFLNKDLLLAQWPVLRRLISRHIRDVWEDAFPELAQAAMTAAAGQGADRA
ncbi:hypothetical protein BOG92_001440 [Streptomyces sp. WAC00263]|nr:hypothetical protein [Streptomyces sp. WAC00263]KAF5990818.1 hypothetical protein BOG92_001440 [Streptomyces sp. WAC00263]